MQPGDRTRQTYRFERLRASAVGVLETAGGTFLLLIAVRGFDPPAGALAKSILAAGASLGLMATPVVVSFVTRMGWPTAVAAGRLYLVGMMAFFTAAMVPQLPVYVIASSLGMACHAGAVPLLTQIYQENYPAERRGHLFSRTVMIRIAVAALFSYVAGQALSGHVAAFPVLLVAFALAFGFSGWCVSRCPSLPLHSDGGAHPFRALRYVKSDVVFRRTLVCWMGMGFANLMMLPLRVEYLANPKYGLTYTAAVIALLTGVIPNIARLIMSPVWGWLFDTMNFFALRVTLNVGFALGILAFFTSNDMTGMVIGAVVYGISNAGGDVAWSLWVTKLAPSDRVADYMSVHTFFTGLRGVAAPLLAFQLASSLSLEVLAAISIGLIVVSSLWLLPEVQWGRAVRKGSALVEEVSD